MADEEKLVVLDMATPVARKPRRIGSVPRVVAGEFARDQWNETARLRPVGLVLSPLNNLFGARNSSD